MSLSKVEIAVEPAPLPEFVQELLRSASDRIDVLQREHPARLSAFVPSDFPSVYFALQAIANADLAAGRSFCEWGSGVGVVALLAHTLGFDSCGIEIDELLVNSARELAAEFDLPVDFVTGSFVPPGIESQLEEVYAEVNSGTFWMVTDADDAYVQLDRDPADFDLIFAYPWPGEFFLIESVFKNSAANGTLLLLLDQYKEVWLQRKLNE